MRIRPYACQHVAVLYIQHGLSIVTCFLGGVWGLWQQKNRPYEHVRGLEHVRVHIVHPSALTPVLADL